MVSEPGTQPSRAQPSRCPAHSCHLGPGPGTAPTSTRPLKGWADPRDSAWPSQLQGWEMAPQTE